MSGVGPVTGDVVVGVGNPWRRDDGVGEAVCAELVRRHLVECRTLHGEPTAVLDAIEPHDRAIIVDAMRSGRPPGTVMVLDASQTTGDERSSGGLAGTHGVGVGLALDLGSVLGRLPRSVHVVAVEGEDFGPGRGLTPAVERAVAEAADVVRRLLSAP